MKKRVFLPLATLLLFTASCSVVGIQNEEQPKYEVLYSSGKKEIRSYKPYLIAKTTIKGNFKEAQSKGFKILSRYIFGQNISPKKQLTSLPISQQKTYEKMSMTSPVFMKAKEDDKDNWTMIFTMPSTYTFETLPKPKDKSITIEQVEAKVMAASAYSGFFNQEKNNKKYYALLKWMNQSKDYNAKSELIFAGYNPPWTLPFFRRNEILIELEPIQ